jgi:hypothetical protein
MGLNADEPAVVGYSTASGSLPSGDMPEKDSPASSSCRDILLSTS